MVREATNKLLEMIEEGVLDRDAVILACVKYMSEDDVADMCRINEFFDDEDDKPDIDKNAPTWKATDDADYNESERQELERDA